jgi:hypothetical protein
MLATTYSQCMPRLYLVPSGLEPVMDYITGERSPVTRKKRATGVVSFFPVTGLLKLCYGI